MIKKAKKAEIGSVSDFAPNDYRANGKSKERRYYLDDPVSKAIKIKASNTWSKMFEGINCIY